MCLMFIVYGYMVGMHCFQHSMFGVFFTFQKGYSPPSSGLSLLPWKETGKVSHSCTPRANLMPHAVQFSRDGCQVLRVAHERWVQTWVRLPKWIRLAGAVKWMKHCNLLRLRKSIRGKRTSEVMSIKGQVTVNRLPLAELIMVYRNT